MGAVDTVLVCLAAGDGSRMGLDYPKCLLDFDGTSLLELELEAFYRLGIRRMVICVGFGQERITGKLGNAYGDMTIVYVENPDFALTGAGYSLWLARRFWKNQPAIVIEADLLLHPSLVSTLWHAKPNAGLLDQDAVSGQGDVTLTGFPARMIWPSSAGITGVVLPLFHLTSFTGLDEFLDDGEIISPLNKIRPLNFALTQGLPWVEIDAPGDLEKAKLLWDRELKSLYSFR